MGVEIGNDGIKENDGRNIRSIESDSAGSGSGAGSYNSDHTEAGAGAGSGRKKRKSKSTSENLEWLTSDPEEVSISGDVPKLKKSKGKTSKKVLDTKENLLQIFSVVSIFAGSIWKLDEKEAESIALPLDSILSRYNLLDRMEKYGDVANLTIVSISIFLPRVMYQIAENTRKREEKNDKKRKAGEGDRGDHSTDAGIHPASIKNDLSFIP